jgi:spore maturation protein CgeB
MKKILMYRWRAYNYLDIKKTFEKMGYEITELWQHLENYDVDEVFAEKLREELRAQTYEFVFTVNYFALIAEVCHEVGIRYVSWTCDNPLISMYHESVFYDTNRIFTFDETNLREFQAMGVKNIYYLPLAVDTDRIDAMLAEYGRQEVYANEVAFVGSLYERNSYDRMEGQLTDYLRGYFDGIMEVQSDLYGSNILEPSLTPDILEELSEHYELEKSSAKSFSDLGLIFSTTTLGFKVAQIQRIHALQELSKRYAVSLYSNSDTSMLPLVQYRGGVEYWTEMPQVFHNTKVNLNFTIPNIKSGIPLRMWDVLGCGGFLLSNFQAETPRFFKEGEHLVSFYSRDDMIEKVGFYLEHDTERQRIAKNGHDLVQKLHNYDVRMSEMMEALSRN